MNPDKLKIFQTEFDKSKKDGLTEQEKNKLEELFRQVPKDKQEEFLAKKDNLSEPLKSFVEGLKQKLNNLRNDVDKVKLEGGFEAMKENFKDSEIAKEFFDLIDSYIDLKLDKNFSKKQKDQIKLALLGEVESGFNLNTIGEGLLNKVLKPLKQKIENLKREDFEDATNTDNIPGMSEITNSMGEMFSDFGLDLKVKELDKKIEDINVEKDSGEISDLKSVLTIINPDNAENINFDTIKTKTETIIGTLNKGRNATNSIQEGLKNLPFNLGDMITSWIKGVIKKGGILGMILGFFFGKEFMDETKEKQENSLENLKKYTDSSNFALEDNLKKEDLKDLKSKDLEKFYKYLDSKDIDYSTEFFWQELLTGKTKDTKISEVYNLLKNKDGQILKEDDKLDNFTKKLNSLSELEEQKEQEKTTIKIKDLSKEKEILANKTITVPVSVVQKQQKSTANIGKKIQGRMPKVGELKKQIDFAKKSLKNMGLKKEDLDKELNKLDHIIEQNSDLKKLYKIEKEEERLNQLNRPFSDLLKEGKIRDGDKLKNILVDKKNHTLQIGTDKYKVKIEPIIGKDKLEKISFKNGILHIEAAGNKKDFKPNDLKDILKRLISKGEINDKIPDKLASLVIQKVSK